MPVDTAGNAAKRVADTSPGPWKAWSRRMSRHARAIKFIETYCRAPKGSGHGTPIKLARFQKEFLEEALAEHVDEAILATPRGNGKSTFGGALAVWAVFDDDDTGAPQVPIVATTVGQAIRSCYGVAGAMVKADPELLRRALIYTGIGTSRITVPANAGELFPISNDPDGLQGLDYSLSIVDEIGFQPALSWSSMTMAAGKRDRQLALGVGTPGVDEDNALFLVRKLLQEGAIIPGLVFHEHAAPDDCELDDRKAWRVANPAITAGFLRVSALEKDLATKAEGLFRIFRLGQHYKGVDSWLGPNGGSIWEALTNPYEFDLEANTFIGIDIGLKKDTSAVVVVQRRPDEEGKPANRYHATCRIWRPTEDKPVDVTDVMQYIRDVCATFSVTAISYDTRFFDVPAKMLLDEGLPMFEVPQSVERMTPAYGSLHEAIRNGQITHEGDRAFATQVLNGIPRFSERGFMLDKFKSRGKIDAATALALAYDMALRHEGEGPSVYETRGLVTFG